MKRFILWNLEAGAGVTMPSAPHTQLELVPDGELNNPGHILVAPRLDNKDGSLTTSVVVDRSRLLVPTVPGGEHLALHLGLEHVLEAGDVDIAKDCLLTLVKSRLALGSPGWLVVTVPKKAPIHRKMVVDCPLVITSKVKLFLRPDKTRTEE